MFPVTIKILDLDGTRLALAEREIRRGLRQYAIEGSIVCVGCGLEIARQGFSEALPALLMNQYTISTGKIITKEIVETFCQQFLVWQERSQKRISSPAGGTIVL